MNPTHVRLKTVSLKGNSMFSEQWVQDVIKEDPQLLGIGDVVVRDYERRQPGAGRLDLLLQDRDGNGRYEVEIQLGATDESHIIRTIEYWDIERRRFPKYDHTAVIVAEVINSRFLNVVSLFNGFIPLMALQLSAIETAEGLGLHFTKVLDTVRLGDEDDDDPSVATNRDYWETQQGTPATVKLADSIFDLIREFEPKAEPRYNKFYIGIRLNGKPCNFATLQPQRKALRLYVRLPQSKELQDKLESAGIGFFDFDTSSDSYRFKLQQEDIATHRDQLKSLLKQAHDSFTS